MAVYMYNGKHAINHFATNPSARWYKPGVNVNDPSGMLAVQRLKNKIFEPYLAPEFSFDRSDRIYMIGSCFARGLELSLANQGFLVESSASEFNTFELSSKGVTQLGFTNKYNTFSIRNELEWAIDPSIACPDSIYVQIGPDRWVDPHTNPTLKFVGYEDTVARRRIINTVTGRIVNCQLIVITLGLIEAWYDHASHYYLNMTPTQEMLKNHPDRFSFHVSSYHQNISNLEAIYDLLQTYCQVEHNIVVTVSPIPLMATFSPRDIVIANTFSKSMLRTVAEEWSARHANVHYFPSYEIALNSEPATVWSEDGRHIKGDFVKHIIQLFKNCFYNDTQSVTSNV